MDELKLLSFNCRGLGGNEKRRDVLNYLKNLHYDIYLLQDTHLTESKEPFFNTLWRGKGYHSFGTFNSRGVSLLFNPRTHHKVIYEEKCPGGNYVILVCTVLSNTYTIVNIYGPNEDRPSFFHQINEALERLPDENVIIGGDFNFVINFQQDSNYSRQNNPRARDAFLHVIEEQDLTDIWSRMNPGKRAITWTRQNPYKFGRLDKFFISEHLTSQTVCSSIVAGYRSDHSIITLQIKAPQKKRGPGLWKFNDSLLTDRDYDDAIKELVFNVIKQYAIPVYNPHFISDPSNFRQIQFTISNHSFYETLLMMIRGETVKFSKRKARACREKEKEIIGDISRNKAAFHANPVPQNLRRLEETQKALEDLRKPRIQGLITRSRVRWHESGETCSKFFLSPEKRNAVRNSIQSLKIDDYIITDKVKILEYVSENLRKKYLKSPTSEPSAYLNNCITQKLSDDEREALDITISLNELKVALMKMKKGKHPDQMDSPQTFTNTFGYCWGISFFEHGQKNLRTGKT